MTNAPGAKRLEALGLHAPPADGPAILLYDIETAPARAWVWGAYDQNIIDTDQDWYLLSFAYRWLGSKKTGFVSIFQDPNFEPDTDHDWLVAESLHALFDRADITVAHNGDRFDRRKANVRFLYWDMDPPSPYQTVDTKLVAAREFAHLKNSLNDLGRFHELGAKVQHSGFDLWRRCMAGDPKAWKLMEKYNRQDVALLEKLYLRLVPWMGLPGKPAAPNLGHWSAKEACPKCGRKNTLIRRGVHRTSVSEFHTVQCSRDRGGCGGYSRERKRIPQPDGGVSTQ